MSHVSWTPREEGEEEEEGVPPLSARSPRNCAARSVTCTGEGLTLPAVSAPGGPQPGPTHGGGFWRSRIGSLHSMPLQSLCVAASVLLEEIPLWHFPPWQSGWNTSAVRVRGLVVLVPSVSSPRGCVNPAV